MAPLTRATQFPGDKQSHAIRDSTLIVRPITWIRRRKAPEAQGSKQVFLDDGKYFARALAVVTTLFFMWGLLTRTE